MILRNIIEGMYKIDKEEKKFLGVVYSSDDEVGEFFSDYVNRTGEFEESKVNGYKVLTFIDGEDKQKNRELHANLKSLATMRGFCSSQGINLGNIEERSLTEKICSFVGRHNF